MGYIAKWLSKNLKDQGVTLITRLRKNMKNMLMTTTDKYLLFRRAIIESIYNMLKSFGRLEHTRHRSPTHAFCHILATLCNYQLCATKPIFLKKMLAITIK